MWSNSAWASPVYRETVLIVLALMFVAGVIVYFLRNKNHYFVVSWASIKSWLVAAPLLFGVLGTPQPYPLISLTLLAMLGAKVFFQILGMYHRSWFVIICYAGIVWLSYCVSQNRNDLYNLAPMMVLGLLCMVPILRNNYKFMVQYMALSLLAFAFMGLVFYAYGIDFAMG